MYLPNCYPIGKNRAQLILKSSLPYLMFVREQLAISGEQSGPSTPSEGLRIDTNLYIFLYINIILILFLLI